MRYLANPHRRLGQTDVAKIKQETAAVQALLALCPVAHETPLHDLPELAQKLGVGQVLIKDERPRMGLGSFKALGAAYVVARRAADKDFEALSDPAKASKILQGECFVAASAGNHGLSLAAGAAIFGARSVIYLAKTVPESFADRLREKGADVVIAGDDYEASLRAASEAAKENGWDLISDSTWEGYEIGTEVMQGYLAMPQEIAEQTETPPTHIFLQAGVGGLAAGLTRSFRANWGDTPQIIVVEPEFAPAIIESIAANAPVYAGGPESNMGRLDCKEPSIRAFEILRDEADSFITLSDDFVADAIKGLEGFDIATSPSGGAGFAGLVASIEQSEIALDENSRVLCIVSEGPA